MRYLRNLGWDAGPVTEKPYSLTLLSGSRAERPADAPGALYKHWRDCPCWAICRIEGLKCNLLRGKGQSFVVLLSVFWRLFKTVYFLTDTTNYLLTKARETFWALPVDLLKCSCYYPFFSPSRTLQMRNKNKTQIPPPFECRDHEVQKWNFFLIFFSGFHWVSPPVLETALSFFGK